MIEVLFIGKIKNLTPEYEEYNDSLYSSAKTMDGFIGIDTEVVDGVEITISKWKTKGDVELWARDPQHLEAKRKVGLWYDWYRAKHFDCIDR
jgi:heme-degrading monooxygenase HmoA